jgi:hypothetical protein
MTGTTGTPGQSSFVTVSTIFIRSERSGDSGLVG